MDSTEVVYLSSSVFTGCDALKLVARSTCICSWEVCVYCSSIIQWWSKSRLNFVFSTAEFDKFPLFSLPKKCLQNKIEFKALYLSEDCKPYYTKAQVARLAISWGNSHILAHSCDYLLLPQQATKLSCTFTYHFREQEPKKGLKFKLERKASLKNRRINRVDGKAQYTSLKHDRDHKALVPPRLVH